MNTPLMLPKFHGRFMLRPVDASDVPAIAVLESSSYPADEAATPEGLAFRQANAGSFFKVCTQEESDEPVGFVCGTLTQDVELAHESMEGHDPQGSTLCVHSVVVAPAFRRKGLAHAMLVAYTQAVHAEAPEVQRVLLIAKAYLLKLYVSAGFQLVGLSPIVHGRDPWFEMRLDLQPLHSHGGQPFVQVDSFASEVLRGNPAAVVFAHGPAAAGSSGGSSDAAWMQRCADEFHCAETAFVKPFSADGAAANGVSTLDGSTFQIRWFTPSTEVALCGHATLAAAHALFSTGRAPEDRPLVFHTLSSGVLTVTKEATGDGGGGGGADGSWLVMDFPSEPATADGAPETYEAVAAALGLSGDGGGNGSVVLFAKRNRLLDLLVEVKGEAFARIKPDLNQIKALGGRGVCVTAAVGDGEGDSWLASLPSSPPPGLAVNFVSRFFAPAVGIDEDPVTGSAHCALAPYWAAKSLEKAAGGGGGGGGSGGDADGLSLVGWQASLRGGAVKVAMAEKSTRVKISGQAATAMDGILRT